VGRLTREMDGKLGPPDALIARMAGQQHGVISIAQMRQAGVSDDAVRSRVLAGRLHRMHRSVYAVGHVALSFEGRCMAAVLALGSRPGLGRRHPGGDRVLDHWGAAVSHRSATAVWGLLDVAEGPVDVSVTRGGRAKRRDICVHRPRSLEPAHVTLCHGIPVTTPARTIADLRRAISLGRSGAISVWALRKAIRQANVLGLPIDKRDAADRTRSDLERDFLLLCHRHRLPRPEVNVRIGDYLADFLWRQERLVVETDSYRYHRGEVAFHEDRVRELELMRLGYHVLRLSETQIDDAPKDVAEVLRAELRRRVVSRER
jgi:very-short-patch-repair endonuclease